MEVMEVQKKIQHQINDKIDKQQREFFLREQLKAIKTELGMDEDERASEAREMRKKLEELCLKERLEKRLRRR
jgi:ATP-dependent Lon protease